MLILLKLGLVLGASPGESKRWRQVAVVGSVAFATFAVLAAVGVVQMTSRQESRVLDRTGRLADSGAETHTLLLARDDSWRGEQYSVVWLEAASGAPALPPGLTAVPAAGEAVLSPALMKLVDSNPELQARYPRRSLIAPPGLYDGGELIAYVGVPAGHTLAGSDVTAPIRDFGDPGNSNRFFTIGLISPVDPFLVAIGCMAFVVVPAVVILLIGIGAASPVRRARLIALSDLGAGEGQLALLALAETLVLAIPASGLGLVGWTGVAHTLETIPVVDHQVLAGDLVLSPAISLAGLAAVLSLSAVAAAWGSRLPSGMPARRRRRAAGEVLSAGALALAALGAVAGTIIAGRPGSVLLVISASAITLLVTLTNLTLVRMVGNLVRGLPSAEFLIAGRALEWAPAGVARTFAAASALIVISGAALGWITFVRDVGSPPPQSGPPWAVAGWSGATPADIESFRESMRPFSVFALAPNSEGLALMATCTETAAAAGLDVSCSPSDPYEWPADAVVGPPRASFRLVPPGDGVVSRAMVLGAGPQDTLHERVRTATFTAGLVAPTVVSPVSATPQSSPLTPWLWGGLCAAGMLLGLGVLVAVVDRHLTTLPGRAHLIVLGVTVGQLRRLEALRFAIPYAATATLSAALGAGLCLLVVQRAGVSAPVGTLLVAGGIIAAFGALGTVLVTLFAVPGGLQLHPSDD